MCACIESTPTGKHDTSLSMAQLSWDASCVQTLCLHSQRNSETNMCIQSTVTNTFSEIHHWIRQFHHSQRSNHRQPQSILSRAQENCMGEVRTENFNISTDISVQHACEPLKSVENQLGWDTDLENPEVEQEKNITGSNLRIFKVSLAQGNLQKLPPCRCTVVISCHFFMPNRWKSHGFCGHHLTAGVRLREHEKARWIETFAATDLPSGND